MKIKQVTVLIPTYRRYDQLLRLLESLSNQTFTNFEVIISDNSEIDLTPPESLWRYISDLDIEYIRQVNNLGLVGNDRFLRSKGKASLVMLLHDDDVIPDNYLEELVLYMEKSPNCSAVAGKGIRNFNGEYWYDYEDYSSDGVGYYSRTLDLIARFNGFYFSFEHFYYALYKRSSLVYSDFMGLPYTTYLLFSAWNDCGYLHTCSNTFYIKNTTSEELSNHLHSNYFIENSVLYRLFSKNIARRVTVGYILAKIAFRSSIWHGIFVITVFVWYSIFRSRNYNWRPKPTPEKS